MRSETLPQDAAGQPGQSPLRFALTNACAPQAAGQEWWDQLTAHRVELIGDFQELFMHLEANLLALQDKSKES